MSGAEALLERHQELRTDIDTRAPAFSALESFGGQLMARQHFANTKIKDKLRFFKKVREALE